MDAGPLYVRPVALGGGIVECEGQACLIAKEGPDHLREQPGRD